MLAVMPKYILALALVIVGWIPAAHAQGQPPTPAVYRFDQTNEDEVLDRVGVSDGISQGGYNFYNPNGPLRGSWVFYGGSEGLQIPHTEDIAIGRSSFTLSLKLAPLTIEGTLALLSKVKGTADKEFLLLLEEGVPVLHVESGSNDVHFKATSIEVGAWEAGRLTVSVNFEYKEVIFFYQPLSGQESSPPIVQIFHDPDLKPSRKTKNNLYIGWGGPAYSNWAFTGALSDIRLYERALDWDAATHGDFAQVEVERSALNEESLVAHYACEDGIDGMTLLESEHGLHGYLPSHASLRPRWKGGISGNALEFNGNDYVAIPDDDKLSVNAGDPSGTDGFTISAWIFPYRVTSSMTVVSKVSNSSQKEYALIVTGDGRLKLSVEVDANNAEAFSEPVIKEAYSWYHVAVVVSGTKTNGNHDIQFYVDGQPVGFESCGGSTGTLCIDALPDASHSDEDVEIGRLGGNYQHTGFVGKIDELILAMDEEWQDSDMSAHYQAIAPRIVLPERFSTGLDEDAFTAQAIAQALETGLSDHDTRDAVSKANLLLYQHISGDDSDGSRLSQARALLDSLLNTQQISLSIKQYGNFPAKIPGENVQPDTPDDKNWYDFIGMDLSMVLALFGDVVGNDLRHRLEGSLYRVVYGAARLEGLTQEVEDYHGNVIGFEIAPYSWVYNNAEYTNPALMQLAMLDQVGARLGLRDVRIHAVDGMENMRAHFDDNVPDCDPNSPDDRACALQNAGIEGAFGEFGSSTYYGVDLAALQSTVRLGRSRSIRAGGYYLRDQLLRWIRAMYNPTFKAMVPPYDRARLVDPGRRAHGTEWLIRVANDKVGGVFEDSVVAPEVDNRSISALDNFVLLQEATNPFGLTRETESDDWFVGQPLDIASVIDDNSYRTDFNHFGIQRVLTTLHGDSWMMGAATETRKDWDQMIRAGIHWKSAEDVTESLVLAGHQGADDQWYLGRRWEKKGNGSGFEINAKAIRNSHAYARMQLLRGADTSTNYLNSSPAPTHIYYRLLLIPDQNRFPSVYLENNGQFPSEITEYIKEVEDALDFEDMPLDMGKGRSLRFDRRSGSTRKVSVLVPIGACKGGADNLGNGSENCKSDQQFIRMYMQRGGNYERVFMITLGYERSSVGVGQNLLNLYVVDTP